MTELTHEQRFVKGTELISQGDTKMPDGTKVDPLTMYCQNFPVIMQINHKRRLLEAYKNGGQDEVIKYIQKVKSLINEQA